MAVPGRKATIDLDPRKREIVAAITRGDRDVEITKQFGGITVQAVRRYRAKMAAEAKAKAKESRELSRKHAARADVLKAGPVALERAVNKALLQEGAAGMLRTADAILTQLEKRHAMLEKLLDVCDRWLEDPADPTRYSLAPRTTEIAIHVGLDGRGQRTTLGELLNRAEDVAGVPVTLVENGTKTADPRRLVRDTAETARGVLETLAKVGGLLKPEVIVNLTQVAGYPELQARFGHAARARPELLDLLRWLASGEGPAPAAAIEAKAEGGVLWRT